MAIAIGEIKREPNEEPDTEPNPGYDRELKHQIQARDDRNQWCERYPRHAKGTRSLWITAAQEDHACGDQHECEQRSDVRQVDNFRNVGESGKNGDEYSGENGTEVRCLEAWMNSGENRRQQPITRHRKENTRLPQLEDEQHAAHSDDRTERNDQPR